KYFFWRSKSKKILTLSYFIWGTAKVFKNL
ncbi:MAG: hypothetical protein ACJATA_002093, partial [Sphingobacteriales bacterium]